nr:hypothetical protein CFP56_09300 [Quercus suber]
MVAALLHRIRYNSCTRVERKGVTLVTLCKTVGQAEFSGVGRVELRWFDCVFLTWVRQARHVGTDRPVRQVPDGSITLLCCSVWCVLDGIPSSWDHISSRRQSLKFPTTAAISGWDELGKPCLHAGTRACGAILERMRSAGHILLLVSSPLVMTTMMTMLGGLDMDVELATWRPWKAVVLGPADLPHLPSPKGKVSSEPGPGYRVAIGTAEQEVELRFVRLTAHFAPPCTVQEYGDMFTSGPVRRVVRSNRRTLERRLIIAVGI